MKINYKSLFVAVFIPLLFAFLIGAIVDTSSYQEFVKPAFAPPSWVFPVVWTILYFLMGVSSYIVYQTDSECQGTALSLYIIQLAVNYLWSAIFFSLNAYLFAFIWLLLLIFLVGWMIKKFYCVSPLAAYLQIPYFLWLIFAALLNLFIVILN